MKRQALDHTKMDLLMRKLSLPRWGCVGILESIWHLTAREAPRGDIGRLSNERIAIGIDWRGAKNRPFEQEADRLVSALEEAGWIEASDEYRLVVHDWHEHADDSVRKMLSRNGRGFVTDGTNSKLRGCVPTIYVIAAKGTDLVKIGFTEGSVKYRLKSLQTGSSHELEVLVSFPGTKTEETRLHKRFASFSRAGEWFSYSDEIREFVRHRQTMADSGSLPVPEPVPEPAPAPASAPASAAPTPVIEFNEYPKTAAAVRRRFPSADVVLVAKIVQASAQRYVSADNPQIPPPDDSTYAAAVEQAAQESGRKQTSAGLFLSTVPAVIESWARVGRTDSNQDGATHWVKA